MQPCHRTRYKARQNRRYPLEDVLSYTPAARQESREPVTPLASGITGHPSMDYCYTDSQVEGYSQPFSQGSIFFHSQGETGWSAERRATTYLFLNHHFQTPLPICQDVLRHGAKSTR